MHSHSRISPVAELTLRHCAHPDRMQYIYPNDQFDLGRNDFEQAFGEIESTISAHHLRFHCVLFEGDELEPVPPLVYVRVLSRNSVELFQSDSNNPTRHYSVSRESGDVLLDSGDVLRITSGLSIIFTDRMRRFEHPCSFDKVRQVETLTFAGQYEVSGRILGSGGNASVFVALQHSSGRQFACKVLALPDREATTSVALRSSTPLTVEETIRRRKKVERLQREYDILKNISHPNIVSLEKVFYATYNIYIIQELITGGDLLSYLEKSQLLGEPESAMIIKQILEAVKYLHGNDIVHRDIKPENVLITARRAGARIVLTDFGQARRMQLNSNGVHRMQTLVGTFGYTAPEVFAQMQPNAPVRSGYGKAIDIWSTGCVAATLLSGEPTFPDDDTSFRLKENRFDLSFMNLDPKWCGVSRKAKSFIRNCLTLDERSRLDAESALTHAWLTNRHYVDELEAAYKRAISGWQPKTAREGMVEYINTQDAVQSLHEDASRTEARVTDQYTSRFFQPTWDTSPGPNPSDLQHIHMYRARRRHTPLPSITGDHSLQGASPARDPKDEKTTTCTSISLPRTHPYVSERNRDAPLGRLDDLPDSFHALSDSVTRPPPMSQWGSLLLPSPS